MVSEGQLITEGRIARRVVQDYFATNGDVLPGAFRCQSGRDEQGNPTKETDLSITYWEGLEESQEEADRYTSQFPTRSGSIPGLSIFDANLIAHMSCECGAIASIIGNPEEEGKIHDDRHCLIPGCPTKGSAKTFVLNVLRDSNHSKFPPR